MNDTKIASIKFNLAISYYLCGHVFYKVSDECLYA